MLPVSSVVMTSSWALNHRATLFFHEHQLAVFDFEIFHVVGKLELIALLGEFFLQHFVDQDAGTERSPTLTSVASKVA